MLDAAVDGVRASLPELRPYGYHAQIPNAVRARRFRKPWAVPGLERIVEDGPEELAETAKAALARIENPVEKLKNAVLPDASPDDGARLLYRTIAQGRGAPDTVYGPIRLSSTLNGPNVRKTVAYWKDRNGKTVDIPFSSYGVNAFLVPFPRAGWEARPEHATSTWFWSKRSTRSLTCSPAPSTDRTGRFSTSAGHHPGMSDPP